MNVADPDLELLLDAAAEAGRIALGYFRKDPEVWWKEGNSPVSEADLAVDAFLKERLLAARPGYGWLSEESAASQAPSTPEPERFFVVDPIDGTRSFLRGEDTWCVALAVVERNRPFAAAIDVPRRAEVFAAARGAGSTLNGERLDAREPTGAEGLRVAMPDEVRRRLDPEALRALRSAPSAPSLAYRIAQVASGQLDGTLIRPNAKDWDIAAADLILAEAGGHLGDIEGETRLYKLEGRRHGLLIAGAGSVWPRLQGLARGPAKAL